MTADSPFSPPPGVGTVEVYRVPGWFFPWHYEVVYDDGLTDGTHGRMTRAGALRAGERQLRKDRAAQALKKNTREKR